MTKDFMIIPRHPYSVKNISVKLVGMGAGKKIKIARDRYVLIDETAGVFWDICSKVIKGTIYDRNEEVGKQCINEFIHTMDGECVIVDFYGHEPFLNNVKIKNL